MAQPISPAPPRSGTAEANAALDAAGQALFRLGRLFGRQPLVDALVGRPGRSVELSRVLVVQVVSDASRTASSDDGGVEVTVGVVAERLRIDPSTASRLVAETVRDGYLIRSTSPRDGRRASLTLTEAGRALDAASRRYQRAVFDQATDGWSDDERDAFARLFLRFATALAGHPDLSPVAPQIPDPVSAVAPAVEHVRA